MPTPKKPTQLKVLSGTGRKDRTEVALPEFDLVSEFPEAPKHLNLDGSEMWCNLGPQLVKARVLQVVDLYVLEQVCFMWQVFRQKAKAGMESTASENNALRGFFSELGMTPASRSKVQSSDKVKEGNKFASNGIKKVA